MVYLEKSVTMRTLSQTKKVVVTVVAGLGVIEPLPEIAARYLVREYNGVEEVYRLRPFSILL